MTPMSSTALCEQVFDLLNARRCLVVREDAKKRVNVVGLTQVVEVKWMVGVKLLIVVK